MLVNSLVTFTMQLKLLPQFTTIEQIVATYAQRKGLQTMLGYEGVGWVVPKRAARKENKLLWQF